jgi:hypothetical protein
MNIFSAFLPSPRGSEGAGRLHKLFRELRDEEFERFL